MIIDCHGHYTTAPKELEAYRKGQQDGLKDPNHVPSKGTLKITDDQIRESLEGAQLKMQRDRGSDITIFSPRAVGMGHHIGNETTSKNWTEHCNELIHRCVSLYPKNFVGVCQLPQSPGVAPKNCIPELERCVNELGFGAIYLSPEPSGDRKAPGMNEPYWYPVYEYAQKHDLPIIVHGTNCNDTRLYPIPENYQVGFVWEQFLAMQLLSHSDVFDKFPDLRVCVCHAGGALNRFIKTDHHLGQRDTTKNLFFDTCVLDIPVLEAAIKQKGLTNTCFGTEAPGSGGAVRPETGKTSDDLVPVISSFGFLSEEDKIAIFNKNPLRFCKTFK